MLHKLAKVVESEGWQAFGAYDFNSFYLSFAEEGGKSFLTDARTGAVLCDKPVRGFRIDDFNGSREELEQLVGKEKIYLNDGGDKFYVVSVIYDS